MLDQTPSWRHLGFDSVVPRTVMFTLGTREDDFDVATPRFRRGLHPVIRVGSGPVRHPELAKRDAGQPSLGRVATYSTSLRIRCTDSS